MLVRSVAGLLDRFGNNLPIQAAAEGVAPIHEGVIRFDPILAGIAPELVGLREGNG